MIEQIAAVRSSFPSAFSALGVGATSVVGALPMAALTISATRATPDPQLLLDGKMGEAVPVVFALSAFFVTYAIGFALIAIGGRLRGETAETDAARIGNAIRSKNDYLIKFFFEQRSVVEMFDGLAISAALTLFSFGVFQALGTTIPLLSMVFFAMSFLTPMALWRESRKRIEIIEDLVSTHLAPSVDKPSQQDQA